MNTYERLTPLLRKFVENGPAGCALNVTHRGRTVYEDRFGYADRDAKKPIGHDTIYRIFSMSKLVTCTAALKLYEQGLYLLNDPVEEYLPEFKDANVYRTDKNGRLYVSPAATQMRVKDLFCMASGLTYDDDFLETGRQTKKMMEQLKQEKGAKYSTRELVKAVAKIPLAFDPGTGWHYGLSHDVLGALIEVLSGRSFGQFLQDEIFDPLGMSDTSFRLPAGKKDRLCRLYDRAEDGTLTPTDRWDASFMPDAVFESGGGGLLSTLADYTKFAQMLVRGGTYEGERILGRKTVELMATNHLDARQMRQFGWPYLAGYGYGLGVRTMVDKPAGGCNGSMGEFGWCGMMGTWVLIDPAEDLTAVYMQQMFPNFEAIHQPRMRAVIYGALD